jgi:hypothetical protein
MEVFKGATVFNPHIVKTLSTEAADNLLEKLRDYGIMNKDGEENIVDALKKSFPAVRQKAMQVVKKFDFSQDKAGILSWHYRQLLNLPVKKEQDDSAGKCRYCSSTSKRCKCNEGLKIWWKATCLLALIMPSLGAAERVFSLLNNLFNEQQTRALGDMISLALFLAYNKRKL